jgi:hypothetical protein
MRISVLEDNTDAEEACSLYDVGGQGSQRDALTRFHKSQHRIVLASTASRILSIRQSHTSIVGSFSIRVVTEKSKQSWTHSMLPLVDSVPKKESCILTPRLDKSKLWIGRC